VEDDLRSAMEEDPEPAPRPKVAKTAETKPSSAEHTTPAESEKS
jgi:hypothetical protein